MNVDELLVEVRLKEQDKERLQAERLERLESQIKSIFEWQLPVSYRWVLDHIVDLELNMENENDPNLVKADLTIRHKGLKDIWIGIRIKGFGNYPGFHKNNYYLVFGYYEESLFGIIRNLVRVDDIWAATKSA